MISMTRADAAFREISPFRLYRAAFRACCHALLVTADDEIGMRLSRPLRLPSARDDVRTHNYGRTFFKAIAEPPRAYFTSFGFASMV